MHLGVRVAPVGAVATVAACVLSSCGGSPTADQTKAVRTTTTTTAPTTSTSTTQPTTTTPPGVTVPNVIGMKIAAAHATLHQVGLPAVGLNLPCNKGTLASQSVVAALMVAGTEPDVRVGAVPLNAGAVVPPGTRVGITWSGCYGDASAVPAVVGLTFPAARHALHAVGLTWACYSVGRAPTTTTSATRAPTTSTSSATTSSAPTSPAPTSSTPTSSTPTTAPATTTTVKPPPLVLTQVPAAGTVLHPGATVALTMHACPQ